MKLTFSEIVMNFLGFATAASMFISVGMAMTKVSNSSALQAVNALHASSVQELSPPSPVSQNHKHSHKHK